MTKQLVLALCALFLVGTTPALADDDRRGRGHHWEQDDDDRRWQQTAHGKQYKHKKHAKYHKAKKHRQVVVWHGDRRWHPPHGHHHGRHWHGHGHGHGHLHHHGRGHRHAHDKPRYYDKPRYDRRRGHDDWAIYAILALQIVDVLNERQRDSFAWAQQRATTAPIGETITWHEGGARGNVVPLRDGSDRAGRYCREFQQEVIVGNRQQSGYGVACRQPDGAWQMVSN